MPIKYYPSIDPAFIQGSLVLHYDASQITGKVNNDPVSFWADLSGYANNAAQATSTNQPVYKTAQFNSLPAVDFTGTSKLMTFTPLDLTAWTLVMVMKHTGGATGYAGPFANAVASKNGFEITGIGTAAPWTAQIVTFSTSAETTHTGFTARTTPDTTPDVYVWTSAQIMRVDGSGIGSGSTAGGFGRPGGVLCNIGGGDYFLAIVGEVRLYSRALSTTELGVIEAALKTKWGTP